MKGRSPSEGDDLVIVDRGGTWPPRRVAGTEGAAFASAGAVLVSTGAAVRGA